MSGQKDERAEEIIIIRRRHDDDDHHHGGVWKIAFADFMTALMAFFLVMWLINAANTETKARVASYFNPVKLTDSVARKRGLLDLDEKSNADDEARRSSAKSGEVRGKDEKPKDSQKRDKEKDKAKSIQPAAKADLHSAVSAVEQRQHTAPTAMIEVPAVHREQSLIASSASHESGRMFRDPFAPFASPHRIPGSDAAGQGSSMLPDKGREGVSDVSQAHTMSAREDDQQAAAAGSEKRASEAGELLQKLRAEIQRLGITVGPGVEVTVEHNSLVISLTDTATFGMFAVGSAEPNEPMARLMQGLSQILSSRGERIVVRGHTDARPFRGDGRNNNWRLAMARAEAAYAMLFRSGIEDARFERIEAHADRKPKIADDPQAAANRRIEILLSRSAR